MPVVGSRPCRAGATLSEASEGLALASPRRGVPGAASRRLPAATNVRLVANRGTLPATWGAGGCSGYDSRPGIAAGPQDLPPLVTTAAPAYAAAASPTIALLAGSAATS